eukprot:3120814-Rhodomonas_salina.1
MTRVLTYGGLTRKSAARDVQREFELTFGAGVGRAHCVRAARYHVGPRVGHGPQSPHSLHD